MEVVQSPSSLTSISDWLERNLPESILVYNIFELIKTRKLPFFRIWLDDVNNPTTIVMRTDREKCKITYYNMRIYLYSVSQKDGDTIGAMIKCTGCLDFKENMIFHALQEETAYTVQSVLRSIDNTILSKRIETYTYICKDDTLLNCELPVGFQCAPITQNHKILDQETLKKNFIKESKLEAMREAINLGQPTLCVYDKDGDPVAWASQKIYGFVGGLFTVEKHRRKGLGQYVFASMTKMVLEKDGQAFSSIERDNYISIKLHEKLGFKRCPDSMSYVWIECL